MPDPVISGLPPKKDPLARTQEIKITKSQIYPPVQGPTQQQSKPKEKQYTALKTTWKYARWPIGAGFLALSALGGYKINEFASGKYAKADKTISLLQQEKGDTITKYTKAAREIDNYTKKLAKGEAELEKLNKKNDNLTKALDAANQERDGLKTAKEAQQSEYDKIKTELDKLNSEIIQYSLTFEALEDSKSLNLGYLDAQIKKLQDAKLIVGWKTGRGRAYHDINCNKIFDKEKDDVDIPIIGYLEMGYKRKILLTKGELPQQRAEEKSLDKYCISIEEPQAGDFYEKFKAAVKDADQLVDFNTSDLQDLLSYKLKCQDVSIVGEGTGVKGTYYNKQFIAVLDQKEMPLKVQKEGPKYYDASYIPKRIGSDKWTEEQCVKELEAGLQKALGVKSQKSQK